MISNLNALVEKKLLKIQAMKIIMSKNQVRTVLPLHSVVTTPFRRVALNFTSTRKTVLGRKVILTLMKIRKKGIPKALLKDNKMKANMKNKRPKEV